jgi:Flp pilus assembly protein TadD
MSVTPYKDMLIDTAFRAYGAGRMGEAEAALRLAFGGSRHDAYVAYFIGHLCYLRGELDGALFFLTVSLMINPNNARAHNDIGETLRALGQNQPAVAHLERAIALEPSLGYAYGNLAAALVALNRPEEALKWAQESLWKAADKAVAHCDLGSIFGRLNRPKEALRQYHLALELKTDYPHARYFDSLIRLSLGEMPEAWLGHEERLRLPIGAGGRRHHTQERWRGEPGIGGRHILLHAEQGLGDTIQFVRYAPMVAALGAVVVLEVQPPLKTLLTGMAGVTAVHAFDEPLPAFDLHCPLLSLPAAFRTSLADIPARIPYLAADPTRRAAWEERLGPWQKMRIGLAWSGSEAHPSDAARSIPLGRFDWLLSRPDVECHAIQRDIREADRLAMSELPGLADHSAELTDFAETAALVSLMDLVITVDTAPAHLAGALGKPAWLLLAHSPDWRWMRDRSDSPWYPTLRLFRQPKRDDWQPVLTTLNRQLDQWAKLQ